jgi:ribosome biogenesis GTPase
MARKEPTNLYDRHQNKRAQQKKQRAKERTGYRKPASGETEFTKAEDQITAHGELIGQIAGMRGKHYAVLYGGVVFESEPDPLVPKALKPSVGSIVVGDKVKFRITGEQQGVIDALTVRRNHLARLRGDSTRFSLRQLHQQVVAANIDLAVIVASAAAPNFHPSLVDRYLIICQFGNVEPLICLNKSDLTDHRDPVLRKYEQALHIPVIETSTVTGAGLDRLRDVIRGKSVVLVGNSGVGKSSLINQLIPTINLRTRAVSERHAEGRHTTTASHMYAWDTDSYIIDTPGIRNLSIGTLPRTSLRFYFPEFVEYAKKCRYTDCLHVQEPDCAVREAVAEGQISKVRYESYLSVLKDLV